MSFEWAWINTGLIILVFLYGIRKWNGPDQNIRISILEDEQKVMRGNIARLERDQLAANKMAMDTNDRILRELEGIRLNGAKEHPLEEKIQILEDGIFELERTISAMPCAFHAAQALNNKKEGGDE